ncbi:MAG: hypothetical protein ACRD63_11095, partial [Pyrinomonadaceae bacterium]
LFTLRDGDGLLLTTVKWAGGSGKPFLSAGVTPSMEVKSPNLAEFEDPEDLSTAGNEKSNAGTPSNSNEVNPPANIKKGTAGTLPPKDDPQMKKALELLRGEVLQKAA